MDDSENQTSMEKAQLCYGIVGNIPKEFHSADLRAMFTDFINDETWGFRCFHFRHRPEIRQGVTLNDGDGEVQTSNTTCCVVLVPNEKLEELIKRYRGKNWVDRNGKYFPSKAVISKISIKTGQDTSEDILYKTKQEKRVHLFTRTNLEFSKHDLKELPELHPPPLMPNGNVGTPLLVFKELIRACKLPPCVIKKLNLDVSIAKSKKKYSNVPFDYKSLEKGSSGSVTDKGKVPNGFEKNKASTSNVDAKGCRSSDQGNNSCNSETEETEHTAETDQDINRKSTIADEDDDDDDDDDDDESNVQHDNNDDDDLPEEWDRHESLHNDVTSQDRTKERLFEEEIELKWEKGGSGLVFYTDAAFWKQQEEADFDEETADDWDVDMEIYENPDGGDKDSRDLLRMRLEGQWKKGNDITLNKIGGFEKYTRGFGGRLMRKLGWKEGGSLGSSQVGVTEPVVADGQLPKCKRGLGYYGEKLERHVKRPKAERNVIISTIYDEPDREEVNLFESWGPDKLKYVSNVDFIRGKTCPAEDDKM